MATTATVLVPAKIVENAQTTQYTAGPATTAIIDKFTATNYSAGTVEISVSLVASGDTPTDDNLIVKTKQLAAGETYLFPELIGQIILADGYISTIADTATAINMRVCGREVT